MISCNANNALTNLGQNNSLPLSLDKNAISSNEIFELYELNADYELSYQGRMSRSKLDYVVFTFGSSDSNSTALFTGN